MGGRCSQFFVAILATQLAHTPPIPLTLLDTALQIIHVERSPGNSYVCHNCKFDGKSLLNLRKALREALRKALTEMNLSTVIS